MKTEQVRTLCNRISEVYESITFKVYEYRGDFSDCILIEEEQERLKTVVKCCDQEIFAGLQEVLIQQPDLKNTVLYTAHQLYQSNRAVKQFMMRLDEEIDVIEEEIDVIEEEIEDSSVF